MCWTEVCFSAEKQQVGGRENFVLTKTKLFVIPQSVHNTCCSMFHLARYKTKRGSNALFFEYVKIWKMDPKDYKIWTRKEKLHNEEKPRPGFHEEKSVVLSLGREYQFEQDGKGDQYHQDLWLLYENLITKFCGQSHSHLQSKISILLRHIFW